MPFEAGNQLWKNRGQPKKPRKTKREVLAEERAGDVFRRKLQESAARLGDHYIRRAFKSDRVLINAADKLLPDEQIKLPPSFTINFVQFNNSLHVQSQDVSSAVLAGDGARGKQGSEGLASEKRQRQNGLEFHDFKDVPGE